MSSSRRRSRTFDLSSLSADEIQQIHEDFINGEENQNNQNITNENVQAVQKSPEKTSPKQQYRQPPPQNIQQSNQKQQTKKKRKDNRRVSFADDVDMCTRDDNVDASKENKNLYQTQQEAEQQKIKVDEQILRNLTKHFVVHSTSYKKASDTKLRKDLEEIKQEIVGMLENVLKQKSTNSVVLFGNPGCGKRLVIESAVQQIQNNIDQENEGGFGVVRLSGLLHNDESTAFKEIAKQLCKQFGLEYQRLVSQEENLEFLKTILQEISRVNRAVVFILWNLEKFAQKGKQSLLYNLYDALQDNKVMASVIGVTCQLDIDQKFEKRVRSRMAMRKIYVTTPNSESAIQEVLQSMLEVTDSTKFEGQGTQNFEQYIINWNKSLQQTLQNNKVRNQLQIIGQCGYTVKHLTRVAVEALMRLEPENATINGDVMLQAIDEVIDTDGAWKKVVGGLTEAECYMLVSVCRLFKKEKFEVNFEMVFLEYQKCRQQAGEGIILSRTQAFLSFRNLISIGILVPVQGNINVYQTLLQQYEKVILNADFEEVQIGVKLNQNCPVNLEQWLKNEVVTNMTQQDILV